MRAKSYPTIAESFLQNVRRYRDVHLPMQDTWNTVKAPDGCALEQLILYSKNPLPGQANYSMAEDVWKNLSSQERVLALIHVAAEEDLQRFRTEETVSKFIATLASKEEFNKIKNQKQIAYFISSFGATHTDLNGILGITYKCNPERSDDCPSFYYPDGKIKSFSVYEDNTYDVYGSLARFSSVTFFPSGAISLINAKFFIDNFTKTEFYGIVDFHPNGRVYHAHMAPRGYADPISGKKYRWDLMFDENGKLISGKEKI